MTDTPQVLLAHHLKTLKLPTFLRNTTSWPANAPTEGADHVRYLVRLTELELIDRERRMVERRIRQARFPAVKSLDSFDFKAIASLNKMLVLELARCEYVERRENIIAASATAEPARPISPSVSVWRPAKRALRRLLTPLPWFMN